MRRGDIVRKTRARACTVLHVRVDPGRRSWDEKVGDIPLVRLGRTRRRGRVGAVATISFRVLGGGIRGLELVKILVGLDLAVGDVHDTVAVCLGRVLIREPTREDGRHVGRVERGNLAPRAVVLDAAKLGEEHGDAVACVPLDLGLPARRDKVGRVAPRVVVEGEEVDGRAVVAAVKVLQLLLDVVRDVGRRVADGDAAVAPGVEVVLDVARDGADVRGHAGSLLIVNDLVAAEEEEGVGVVGEAVDRREDGLEIFLVVREEGIGPVQRELGAVDVQGEVDARIGEETHALVVVLRVVHRVYADGVDPQGLEVLNIPGEGVDVQQWVRGICGAAGLVGHAADVEALAIGPECCRCCQSVSDGVSCFGQDHLTIALDRHLRDTATRLST